MNRNKLILGIVLIRSYRNSFFILSNDLLDFIWLFLPNGKLGSPSILKLLGIRIVYVSFVLILVTTFEPWLLFNFDLKTRGKDFLLCLLIVELKVTILIVLILRAFHWGVSDSFSKLHSFGLSKNLTILRCVNWTLSRFS
jgi:hypothetical protein